MDLTLQYNMCLEFFAVNIKKKKDNHTFKCIDSNTIITLNM